MCLCGLPGCTWMSYLGTSDHGRELGKTYFIGGAGSVGNVVGTVDVPLGLRQAGYKGATEVLGWQSVVGGTLRDEIDRSRNMGQARRLARRIQKYMDKYPSRPVHIIALSAGTGIATWALESLPPKYHVQTVVFLGSSLSRGYDLSDALRRVDKRLYAFSSTRDPVLRYVLPLTGPIDRDSGTSTAAGLCGFDLPEDASAAVRELYRQRLRNRPYKPAYARYGYHGLHTDGTSPAFVEHVVAPLLMQPGEPPEPSEPDAEPDK